MSDKKKSADTKVVELDYLAQEISRLQIRRASIEQEVAEQARRAENNVVALQGRTTRSRKHRGGSKPSVTQYKSRETVVREQYSQRALNKFVKIKEEILQKYGKNSRSRSFHTPLLDSRRQELRAGDFVRATTIGRNYPDRGIVSRFSKDGSRVFFIDFQGREQNRAPENLAHVDD